MNALDEIYVAKVSLIKDIYWNNIPKDSSELGIFLVKPIKKKNLLGKSKTIGFNEVITNKKVITRYNYIDDFDAPAHIDIDKDTKFPYNKGDLYWEVVEKFQASEVLEPSILEEYLSKTSEEINFQLKEVKETAKKIIEEEKKVEYLGRKK